MVAVALISAFITMRLAIHGREIDVPALVGLSVPDAARLASHDGLNLTLENRFYSADIPAGRVLAQSPAPGVRVRRDWAVRVTESLGAQRVSIPNLEGKSERTATITLRRLSLDPGIVAYLPTPGDPDVVVAQTPTANSDSVTGPRVSLLISATAESSAPEAWVMPTLVGLSARAASARVAELGLRVAPAPASAAQSTPADAPAAVASSDRASGVVVAQSPPAGRRVLRGDLVHLAFGAGSTPPASALSPTQ